MRRVFKQRAARKAAAQRKIEMSARTEELARREIERAPETARQIEDRADMLAQLRPATTKEYADWIALRLKKGDLIDCHDESMRDIYVAERDINLPALHGAHSLKIMVPQGVTLSYDKLGHNALMLPDGKGPGTEYAALYKDTVEELKRRGYAFNITTGPDRLRVVAMPSAKLSKSNIAQP